MVYGGHRKETVITESLGDSGVMGTSTTKDAKHNWILERMKGKGTCVEGAGYHSTGHWCDKAHFCCQHSTEKPRQIQGLVSAASVPRGDPLPLQTGSFGSRGAPRERKLPPLTQPGVCKRREVELGNWKKPGRVSQPGNQSVTVYNVQETTRSQRSFEALGSAC